MEQNLLTIEIHKILDNLSNTDRQVIYDYYFKGMNDEQISQLLGVSQSAVNQRRNRILRDLKKLFEKF